MPSACPGILQTSTYMPRHHGDKKSYQYWSDTEREIPVFATQALPAAWIFVLHGKIWYAGTACCMDFRPNSGHVMPLHGIME